MNKLMLVGLLSLIPLTSLCADEDLSNYDYTYVLTEEGNETTFTISEDAEESNHSVSDEVVEASEKQPSLYMKSLNQAKDEDKILMLGIRATDCHYCDRIEKETLSDKSVQKALEANFVTLFYNQDLEPLPLGLQEGMTPNFVFVDKNENIINMYPGMRNPDEFKEVLREILAQ